MPKTNIMKKPTVTTHSDVKHEDMYEVVLYNDDHNIAEFVATCLMRVFKHDMTMAIKIMMEAHRNGKAIAEVEAKSDAILHKQQLTSSGLTAEVEKV